MRSLFFLAAFAALAVVYATESPKHHPPKVQLYSSGPGEYGEKNILICRVSDFHPPDITIEILKDGVEIPNANQTDLAFKQDWRFHLTKSVDFTPQQGEKYLCKVTHGGRPRDYVWEPNM